MSKTSQDSGSSVSQSLLEQARSDRQAMEKLLRIYAILVFQWLRRMGASEHDAHDLRQETFRRAIRSFATFRRDEPGQSFRKWLRAIAGNAYREFLGRMQSRLEARAIGGDEHQRLLNDFCVEESETQESDEDRLHLVHRCLETIRGDFSERNFACFLQRYMHERSIGELAAEFGMTRQAVYAAVSRIRARFEEEFRGIVDLS